MANRGEIAVRIVRACAEMGITSAAIYSDADRNAPLHVKKADEAYNIGPDPVGGYLNAHRIVNLAVTAGCDALHPATASYPRIHSSPRSARAAVSSTSVRRPTCIRRMGDKIEARRTMIAAGLPVVPGSNGNLKDVAEAVKLAKKIGYPIMLKATGGGGGRGIRRCDSEDDCAATTNAWSARPPRHSARPTCSWENPSSTRAISRSRFWATGRASDPSVRA